MAITIYITHIRMSEGTEHEHIVRVKWLEASKNEPGENETAIVAEWIDGGGIAKVIDGKTTVDVGTVNGKNRKHLRTHANGKWTDNLLSLPRF